MSFKKCFPVLVFSFLLIISIFGFFPKEANANWEIQTNAGSRSWQSIASSSDGTKLAAVVNGGYIYTSTDSGLTWIEQTASGLRVWQSIASSSDGTKLVAGVNTGYIYTSTDSGVTWTQRTNAGYRSWQSIASSSDGTKLVAVDSYIYTSTDSGATWTERSGAGNRYWYSIASSFDGTKLAAVDYGYGSGYIYTSIDSGVTWVEQLGSEQLPWVIISSSSDGTKLVAGVEGDYIYTSTDSGVTWVKRTSSGMRYWLSLSSSSDGTKLAAVSGDSYIYNSIDSGITWTKKTIAGFGHSFYSVTSSADGNILALVDSGGYIYHFYNTTPVLPVVINSSLSFSQTSATLNGNITNSGMDIISERGFQYGLTTSYDSIATEVGAFGTGSFSSNIASLVPNTTYYYRSYATNSIGTSYGEDQTFTTTNIVKPTINTNGESSVTNDSGVLNGNISDTGGENATVRGFQYGITISYGATTVESGSFGLGSFSKNITSLIPNTTYHYRAYATNSIGTNYGQDVAFISTVSSWAANINTQKNWSTIVSSSDGTKLMAISSVADYIYISNDSGLTWFSQTGPGMKSWASIAISSDGTKLFASGSNTFYSSIDGGTTWIQQTSIGLKTFKGIASSSDGTKLVAGVWNGYLYTSIDSGVTWTEKTSLGSRYWYSVASSSDGVKLVAALGSGGSLYTSSDSGANWTIQTGAGSNTWRGIASSSDGTKLIAGTQSGYLYTSKDSGVTWKQQTSLGSRYWLAAASSSDGMKLAVVDDSTNGYIYTSSDGGVTWISNVSAGGRYWQSIASSSDGTKLFTVSDYVYIYGQTSSPVVLTNNYTGNIITTTLNGFSNTGSVIRGFQYGFDTNYGTNITETGTFGAGSFSANVTSFLPNVTYHYRAYATNGMGTSYGPDVSFKFEIKSFISQTNSGIRNWQSVASSSDGMKLAAVVNGGYIYTSTDSGVTWTERTTAGFRYWNSIASSSDGTKLVAAVDSGYIYTSTDSGATWIQRTSSTSRDWFSIASSSDGMKLVAGSLDIFTSDDGGVTWIDRASAGSKNWRGVTSSSDGTKLVAVANLGNLYTSTDSGITWTERTSQGSIVVASVSSSSDGTKLAAAGGGSGDYIYTSIDSGVSWIKQVNSGSRSWSSIASSSDGTKLAAVDPFGSNFSSGYIYTSTDNGVNWTAQIGAGLSKWRSVSLSSNGTKLVAGAQSSFIYTSSESASSLPVLTTSPASSVLQYTATLNGYINNIGGSYNTVRGFEYGLTTGYGTTTTENGSFNIGNFSSNITALIPNTTYHYRSYSTNPAGTSYGQDSIFTTLNLVAPVLETHGEIIVTGVSATLHGAITSVGGDNSTVRGFEYGLTTGYGTTTTENGSFGLGNFSANISSLTAGSTYHYRSYATNSAGTSYGLDKTFIATPNIYSWTAQLNSGYHSWKSIASSADGTKLVAVIFGGYIYTSVDSGVTWTQQNNSGSRYWSSVASSSNGTKLIAGTSSSIYTSADSGVTWTEKTSAGRRYWGAVASSSDGTKLVAAGDRNDYIYTSSDSGLTWTQQLSSGSNSWVSITSSSDGTKLAAVEDNGYIHTSADGGLIWIERTSMGYYDWKSIASSSDGTKLVAVADNSNYIYISIDSGVTWSNQIVSQTNHKWYSCGLSLDGKKVIIVDSLTGNIYTSSDSGATWASQSILELKSLSSISSSIYGTKLAASVNGGYIYSYGIMPLPTVTINTPNITGGTTVTLNGFVNTDSTVRGFEYGLTTSYGTTTTESGSFNLGVFTSNLTALTSGATYHYRSYATNAMGTAYSADKTFVLKLQGWISHTDLGLNSWSAISSSSDGIKLAALSEYDIYTSTDSGDKWTKGQKIIADAIASSSDGSKIVVVSIGSRGDVNISNDSGVTWKSQTLNIFLQSVAMSSDGTKIVIGANSGGYIFTSSDSGATWKSKFINGSGILVASSADGMKLASVANNTNVYTSTDGGLTWISRTSSGIHNWFSIASSSDGMKLVAVGTGIYTSTDGGVSWIERIEFGTNVWHSVSSSNDGVNLIAGTSGGYIYTSSDSGVNWSTQDNVGQRNWYSVSSSSDGMKLAAADYGGYIYTYSSAPVINTEPASVLSETSAILKASITNAGKASPTVRGFEYGLDTNYTKNTEEVGSFTEGSFSTEALEVQPGNTYHYRSYATNSAGTGYGQDLTFLTPTPKSSSHRSSGSSPAVIARFQEEQKALTEQTPVITTPTTPLPITRTLKYKITGDDVKALQVYLNTHGYPVSTQGPGSVGKETSYFGPATRKAVILFQSANKLVADGIVGAMTRGKME